MPSQQLRVKRTTHRTTSQSYGVKIEERSHVRLVWLPTKLEYFKVLTDKSLGVNFIPSIQNYVELVSQVEDKVDPKNPSKVASEDDIEVKENDNVKTVDYLQMPERAIFGFIWKNLEKDFKIRDEHTHTAAHRPS